MPRMRGVWLWLAVAAIIIGIYAFSAQAHSADFTAQFFGEFNTVVRKTAHMLEFAALFLTLFAALKSTLKPNIPVVRTAVASLTFCAACAVMDEVHQLYVPGRTPAVHDVIIDTVGAGIACAAVLLWHHFRRSNKKNPPK